MYLHWCHRSFRLLFNRCLDQLFCTADYPGAKPIDPGRIQQLLLGAHLFACSPVHLESYLGNKGVYFVNSHNILNIPYCKCVRVQQPSCHGHVLKLSNTASACYLQHLQQGVIGYWTCSNMFSNTFSVYFYVFIFDVSLEMPISQ